MFSSRQFRISTVLSACPPVCLSVCLSVCVHRSLPQTQPSSAPACLPSVSVPVAVSRFLPNNTTFTHRRKERDEKKKRRWKETKSEKGSSTYCHPPVCSAARSLSPALCRCRSTRAAPSCCLCALTSSNVVDSCTSCHVFHNKTPRTLHSRINLINRTIFLRIRRKI